MSFRANLSAAFLPAGPGPHVLDLRRPSGSYHPTSQGGGLLAEVADVVGLLVYPCLRHVHLPFRCRDLAGSGVPPGAGRSSCSVQKSECVGEVGAGRIGMPPDSWSGPCVFGQGASADRRRPLSASQAAAFFVLASTNASTVERPSGSIDGRPAVAVLS